MKARLALVALVVIAVAAVRARSGAEPARRALAHDAYVWQAWWSPPVEASAASAPAELGALRVLIVEERARISTTFPPTSMAWTAVDPAAIARARRPVIAVVRLYGARLSDDVSLAPVLARVDAWRAAGVDVIGLEIDHDAATASLGDYAAWLARSRPRGLRWSITALPAWADDPAGLRAVAAAVDEVVVQVHAVKAPRIFDDAEARAWIARVARTIPSAHLRVALPTYRVALGAASPIAVARFLRWLERRGPASVRGVVWFRLPVDGDAGAWPAATLRAVIRGDALAPRVSAKLVERAAGLYDVVVENTGTTTARWPAIVLRGDVEAADPVGGYARAPGDPRRWDAPARELLPGTTAVAGWAAGKAISIDAN